MVSAVPTACEGTDSVTRALNWAESGTTKNPQTIARMSRTIMDPPNTNGATRAQVPLVTIESVTNHSRLRRSAANPPQTLPIAPTAIAANAISSTADGRATESLRPARLAATNAEIHVQNEYS